MKKKKIEERESKKGEGRYQEREELREKELKEVRRETGAKGGRMWRERRGRKVGSGDKKET